MFRRPRALLAAALLRRALPFALVALNASALGAAALAVSSVADATLAREVTLKQLVALSDVAITGTATESKAVWEDTEGVGHRIVTYTKLTVDDVAFGEASGEVWVRTLGGVVGKVGQHVDGEAVLAIGERALVFLKKNDDGTHVVVAMAQGHYPARIEGGAEKLFPSPRLGGLVRSKSAKDTVFAHEQLVGRAPSEALDLVRSERKAAAQ